MPQTNERQRQLYRENQEYREKRKLSARVGRQKNYEKRLASERKWKKENPERQAQAVRSWHIANPERVREIKKRYVERNPEVIKALAATMAARRRNAVGKFSAKDISAIRKDQKGRCAYCRVKLKSTIEHIDHIAAIANGGTNHRHNIQLLCATCNRRKCKRDPIEFARSQFGMLL